MAFFLAGLLPGRLDEGVPKPFSSLMWLMSSLADCDGPKPAGGDGSTMIVGGGNSMIDARPRRCFGVGRGFSLGGSYTLPR